MHQASSPVHDMRFPRYIVTIYRDDNYRQRFWSDDIIGDNYRRDFGLTIRYAILENYRR
jgi:hypothetical protein